MRTMLWVPMSFVLAGCPGDDGAAVPTTDTDPSTTATASPESTGAGSGPADGPTGETSADDTASDDTGPDPLPARVGVTADWLARSLTVIDLDALAAGAQTREELVARVIDLADFAPGPLQVELAPDGRTAGASRESRA